jgi:hypothetical protein
MYCSSHLFPIHIIYMLISPNIRDPDPRYKWVGKSLTCNKHVGFKALCNKGNAKRGVSPRLKIRPFGLDLWPWKSIGFQNLLRTKYVPSLVKIHWRILILECSQGCYAVKCWPLDLWPWKSTGFQILLRTKYVPSLVKIHWRMLILECSQGCYTVKKKTPVTLTFDLANQ